LQNNVLDIAQASAISTGLALLTHTLQLLNMVSVSLILKEETVLEPVVIAAAITATGVIIAALINSKSGKTPKRRTSRRRRKRAPRAETQ
jgi:hypothetical protein